VSTNSLCYFLYKKEVGMIGERLKQRREELGWSQPELARRINSDTNTVWRYENNKNDPSATVLGQFADTLEVTADWLLGLVEDQHSFLSEEALSPLERRLISAARKGSLRDILKATLDLTDDDDESDISGAEPAAKR
jgi:transcriptional regulator with XRE-family HTH domain